MGIQDRDWYKDHHRKLREQERRLTWYNPRLFRRSASIGEPPPINVPRMIGLCILLCFAVYVVLHLIRWATT